MKIGRTDEIERRMGEIERDFHRGYNLGACEHVNKNYYENMINLIIKKLDVRLRRVGIDILRGKESIMATDGLC